MQDVVERFAISVATRLRALSCPQPSRAIIRRLLEIARQASMLTEEGRFVRGSITFANPAAPDISPPFIRRADYPGFTRFPSRQPLSVPSFGKLARAIDTWSASVAVWGSTPNKLAVWGIVDQLAQANVYLYREASHGFGRPGILTITTDAVGDLSAYHGRIFLGAIRGQRLITREHDALRSLELARTIAPSYSQFAEQIAAVLDRPADAELVLLSLLESWSATVARLCIGLRRLGTGGSLVFTPTPHLESLELSNRLVYKRLSAAVVLHVLDTLHSSASEEEVRETWPTGSIPVLLSLAAELARADATDRESEVSGSVKLVTSLAAVDGAVILDPDLTVRAFGAKIGGGRDVATVYDAPSFLRRGVKGRRIELKPFGTRHRSVLRYCRLDPSAIGVVVSQDGHVRVAATINRSLVLWDDVKLLQYHNFTPSVAKAEVQRREDKIHHPRRRVLGYTTAPKTLAQLLSVGEVT